MIPAIKCTNIRSDHLFLDPCPSWLVIATWSGPCGGKTIPPLKETVVQSFLKNPFLDPTVLNNFCPVFIRPFFHLLNMWIPFPFYSIPHSANVDCHHWWISLASRTRTPGACLWLLDILLEEGTRTCRKFWSFFWFAIVCLDGLKGRKISLLIKVESLSHPELWLKLWMLLGDSTAVTHLPFFVISCHILLSAEAWDHFGSCMWQFSYLVWKYEHIHLWSAFSGRPDRKNDQMN